MHFPIISVLFQRGAFDVQAAVSTAQALFCYALGLWAFSLIRVIVSVFYSLQDAKWPVKAAIIALVFNIIASLILMNPLKHNGLALANSLASMVNVIILSYCSEEKNRHIFRPQFLFFCRQNYYFLACYGGCNNAGRFLFALEYRRAL